MTQYTASVEFYGGLTEKTQDDLQQRLSINWTNVGELNAEAIIQGVIDMEAERIERQNLMCCTAPPFPAMLPGQHSPQSTQLPQDFLGRTPHNFTPAPAPEQNLRLSELAAVVNELTIYMAEMANAIKAQYRPQ